MTRTEQSTAIVDSIQKAIVRLVATSPAGFNLLLIGGFRYRFLNRSARTSRDIDYHWLGDLEKKQQELITLFRKRLLPDIRRQFGFDGRADPGTGPDAESPVVRTVLLAFWKADDKSGRIEIPVEITRVLCADSNEVRTMDGVIYPTISDADLIEGKIIAVLNRAIMAHRDLVDIFLFAGNLVPESPARIRRKLEALAIAGKDVAKCLEDLRTHADYHTKAIQAVIDTQVDREAAENINASGGAVTILENVTAIIAKNTPYPKGS